MDILLTGFDPFGGEDINPSWEAVRRLPDTLLGAKLHIHQLPTSFERAPQVLRGLIADIQPDAIICTGQAFGRNALSIERVAVNLQNASLPDNDGATPYEQAVNAQGPAAYFSSLPVHALADALAKQGMPCELSYTAGVYVCNTVMYTALSEAEKLPHPCPAGFIHVPATPEQSLQHKGVYPWMSIDDVSRSLQWCLDALIDDILSN